MPDSSIIQIDQHMFGTRLDRLIAEKVTELLNAMPDTSSQRNHRAHQIRAHRRAEGITRRPLRPELDRQGRQTQVQGAQTQGRGIRIRGDQTLPAAQESVEEVLIGM